MVIYYPNGTTYYDTYDFNVTRRLIGFIEIGQSAHIQGEGHYFRFLRNNAGECAIQIVHPHDRITYIFKNKYIANECYKELRKAAD